MDTEIKFEELGYIISDNNHLLDEEFNITAEAYELILDDYYLASKREKISN